MEANPLSQADQQWCHVASGKEEGRSRPSEATLADLAAAPGEQLRLMGLDAAQASRHPAPPWVWMPSEAPFKSGSLIQLIRSIPASLLFLRPPLDG